MAEELKFATAAEVKEAIGKNLASAPLYLELIYTETSVATSQLPSTVSLFCDKCEQETNWETSLIPGHSYRSGFGSKQYQCRNCKEKSVAYEYYWSKDENTGKALFFKYGQWPELQIRIPRSVAINLDRKSVNLYHRALRCRNQGLGLGSLVYLRRVLEDKINAVLDLIAQEATEVQFASDDIKRLNEVKETGLFKSKIEFASVILPPSLRPGGHNPIDALHDVASDGLHHLTEDECIEVFDRARFVFEYLFREIDARRRRATEYAASVAKLASNRKSRAAGPAESSG